ncbi:hypothetical protein B0H11DRAFT_1732694 [Mycena galericulata]|nr:hypothetical protein B0H11DRAFT_1732694 [Mycena galericulata]
MDPANWENPILDVAYSRGKPAGQTRAGDWKTIPLLKDLTTGEEVPCVLTHTTSTREDVKERLQNDREARLQSSSPSKDVFQRTSAYLAAVQKLGCSRPLTEETFLLASEEEERQARDLYLLQTQRGYRRPDGICEGRLVFGYDSADRPYVCCEHYIPTSNKDHFYDLTIGNGPYYVDYIEAVITGDEEEATRIEEDACDSGYGPLIECCTVSNFSTQKANCPVSHRDGGGALVQPLLDRLPCSSKFRVYEPIEEYRKSCPFILIVTSGEHPHPVPLPTKTPHRVHAQFMNLLERLGEDFPDLTPRRLIRHPIFKSFLAQKFPSIISPTLADWHVSLANRSHLKAYIRRAREIHYPFGTGWAGVVNLKEHQDSKLPKEKHYIRRILAINIDPADERAMNEDDDEDLVTATKKDNRLRIIICMTPEASRRLQSSGRHLQSDIGFKRIVGFKEFEVASMERDANTSIIFVRIFLNRMSALAHQRVFEEIEAIIFEDTGRALQWHHLHATSAEDGLDSMILSWVGDQHRGQAKGLGLHLQKLASQMPRKRNLYELHRFIQELSPYEHLHRNFRVCVVHYYRLVKLCGVPEVVRWLMRGLVCMEHPDWDGALRQIQELGGKPAIDWVNNKVSSQFVFEGICWQKSYMPRNIWEAGDSNSNLIESVHRDANREGVHCTLLGGLTKGQSFDAMKMKTLLTFETTGVRPTYRSGHLSESALINLKRRDNQSHRRLVTEDAKIETWNQKLQRSLDALVKAKRAVEAKGRQLASEPDPHRHTKISEDLEKKKRSESKAYNALVIVNQGRDSLMHIGSGKVSLLDAMIES